MPEKRINKRRNTYLGSANTLSRLQPENALAGLVAYMDQLDNKKLKTLEEVQALIDYYQKTVDELDKLETERGNILVDYEKTTLQNTRRVLGKDMRFLVGYKEKIGTGEPKEEDYLNLEELLENSRSRTITVNEKEVSYAGAGQNVRSIVNDGNKNIFFTESVSGKNSKQELDDLVEEFRRKYGADADFLNSKNVKMAVGYIYMKNPDDSLFYAGSINSASQVYENCLITLMQIPNRTGTNLEDKRYLINREIKNEMQKKIMGEFVLASKKLYNKFSLNKGYQINETAKHDKRNSAMSMVADLIGCPDVIAKSENVHLKIVDSENNVKKSVLGTGMDQAKGLDSFVAMQGDDYLKVNLGYLEGSATLYKNIADMQVLDFICGNPDRHAGNISYIIENGKLVGIQGFDNDTSFGAAYKANGEGGKSVPIERMGIITRSTADKILKMDENQFRVMLYGFDLNHDEVEGAVDRLKMMKKTITLSEKMYRDECVPEGMIIKGVPRVVDEDKLAEYSIVKNLGITAKVMKKQKPVVVGNMFAMIRDQFGSPADRVNDVMENYYNELVKCDGVLEKGPETVRNIVLGMQEVDKSYQTGSENFTNMRNSLTTVANTLGRFSGPLYAPEHAYGAHTPARIKAYSLTDEAKKLKEQIVRAYLDTCKYIKDKQNDRSAYKYKRPGTRAYQRFQFALKTKAELERQLEILDKAEHICRRSVALEASKKDIVDINSQANEEAKENANLKYNEKLSKLEQETIKLIPARMENFFKEHEELIEKYEKAAEKEAKEQKAVPADEQKTFARELLYKTKLEAVIGKGLYNAAGKELTELKKDPEKYEEFRRAAAASVLQYKHKLTYLANDKATSEENRADFNNQLKFLENIKIDVLSDPNKDIDNVLKDPGFNKVLDSLNQNVTLINCLEFSNKPDKRCIIRMPLVAEYMNLHGGQFTLESKNKAPENKPENKPKNKPEEKKEELKDGRKTVPSQEKAGGEKNAVTGSRKSAPAANKKNAMKL